MKLICISDTHTLHTQFTNFPSGDVIIHSGDIGSRGYRFEAIEFIEWYGRLPIKEKILIAGNHDFCFENEHNAELRQTCIDNGIHYLEDSGVTIDGVKFWGSPVTPRFFDWAFNRERSEKEYQHRKDVYGNAKLIKDHWDLIPLDTNVLITHGPPLDVLDLVERKGSINLGANVGCEELANKIKELKDLKLHVFGHIHSGYGQLKKDGVLYVNASSCDERYKIVNKPMEIDYETI